MLLKDKVAVVTGASRGIGRDIAMELARAGAAVAVIDISIEGVGEVAREIESLGGRAIAHACDVSSAGQVEEMIAAVIEKLGRIDILVNNAGITRDTLLVRMKEEDWDAVLAVNLKGVFNCTKAAARTMMKQREGAIVNISSVVGLMGNAGQANYAASKAGIIGFTKSVARELASRNVRVNAIAPGFIVTSMTDALPEEVKSKLKEQIPLGRLGNPGDIAQAVLFLVSPAASYITGQTLAVDGGMVMQ